jgi:hypothetical protein
MNPIALHNSAPRRAARSIRPRRLQLAVVALSLQAACCVSAATKTWNGADNSFWNNINAWSPVNAPVNGDTVIMGSSPAGTTNVTALFTSTYSGAGLVSLKIDSIGIGGLFTLSQSLTTSAMIATTEIIGDTIGGNLYTQNAGSNTATNITLGNSANSGGCYTLNGPAHVSVSNLFIVGNSGSGVLN